VAALAGEYDVPVAAIVGIADDGVRDRIRTASIADLYGLERATREPLWCIEHAARDLIKGFNDHDVSDTL